MSSKNFTGQKALAWCGIVFPIVFFAGMLMAGLLPPHSPMDSAAEIATKWQTDPNIKRLGLFLCMYAGGVTAGYGAIISVYLKKIDPEGSYSNLQLLGAATGVIAILTPVFLYSVASFRTDRPAELTQLINDAAWIPFVMNTPPALMQCFAIALAVFADKREKPIFPRWFAYYQLWTALLFIPGGLVLFFKNGPFAWDGILAFWLVAILFGLWFIVTAIMVLKAISDEQTRDAQQSGLSEGSSQRPQPTV